MFFKKDKEPKDLKQVLKQFSELKNEFKNISQRIEQIERRSKPAIQKTAIIRYNPFSNVGSDQSFSIALLDADNNGIVITSLYSREGNRVYSKPVKNGKSEYSLSKEEEKVIEQAKNK